MTGVTMTGHTHLPNNNCLIVVHESTISHTRAGLKSSKALLNIRCQGWVIVVPDRTTPIPSSKTAAAHQEVSICGIRYNVQYNVNLMISVSMHYLWGGTHTTTSSFFMAEKEGQGTLKKIFKNGWQQSSSTKGRQEDARRSNFMQELVLKV